MSREKFFLAAIANGRKGKASEVVAVAGGFVRETECGAHSLKSAQKVKLLLHAESEARACADFLHVDFLEPDALKAGTLPTPKNTGMIST